MPHFPKPFFRPARGLWHVQLGGKQVNLGPDQAAAFKVYHDLMARPDPAPAASPAPSATTQTRYVVVVVDDFLDWCEKNRAPDTYRWYKDRLNSFVKTIPPELTTDHLKSHHVQKWVDGYAVPLASGSCRNLIASVKRSMKWAEEQGYIDRSPLTHMRKPGCGRREQVVTPAQYHALLEWTGDQAFKGLLTATWETGCRPQESLRLEARHVDLAGQRWVLTPSEAKGKKTPRVIYLTPAAGRRWTPYATNCRLRRARKTIGVKISLYVLRHTWISRFPCPVATLVEQERRAAFDGEGQHFQSQQYLTLTYLPSPEAAARLGDLLIERPRQAGAARGAAAYRAHYDQFVAQTDGVASLLSTFMPHIQLLDDGATLIYLHACVSDRALNVAVPPVPFYLDEMLTDRPLVGGLSPRLGDMYLKTVSVRA